MRKSRKGQSGKHRTTGDKRKKQQVTQEHERGDTWIMTQR